MTVTTRPDEAGREDKALEQLAPPAVTDELQALERDGPSGQAYSIQIQPPLVVFHGAAYFLDPPAQAGTYPNHRGGFSALYQVTPSGARHAR